MRIVGDSIYATHLYAHSKYANVCAYTFKQEVSKWKKREERKLMERQKDGYIVRWRGILGDQGLVCVFSAIVMSCQDNWNEKHT